EARPENGSPAWCAVTDTRLGESLLLEPTDNSLLTERSLQFGDKHIQLEYLTRRHLSQPGEALTLKWRLQLVKNFSEAPPTPASFRELDALSSKGSFKAADEPRLRIRIEKA